eukprot:351682-Chlamydomonas_euryale.AAC.3
MMRGCDRQMWRSSETAVWQTRPAGPREQPCWGCHAPTSPSWAACLTAHACLSRWLLAAEKAWLDCLQYTTDVSLPEGRRPFGTCADGRIHLVQPGPSPVQLLPSAVGVLRRRDLTCRWYFYSIS